MEPLNNRHVGTGCFVHCREAVLSLEVEMHSTYRRCILIDNVGQLLSLLKAIAEPLNIRHIGMGHIVHCGEVVLTPFSDR